MADPLTFPKTDDHTWTNSETGVQIVLLSSRYEVRMPSTNMVGWQHAGYAKRLDAARSVARAFAASMRSEVATAYDRASVLAQRIHLDATWYERGEDHVITAINADTSWYGNAVRAEMQRREDERERAYDEIAEAYL